MSRTTESRHLEELRREFDQAFALPPRCQPAGLVALLAIRAAGEALALETRHITGLVKRRQVVPLPSRAAGLLGIAGIRGALVPVYSLAALLGLTAGGEPQWLALANRAAPLALAFEELEGRVEVAPGSLHPAERTGLRQHIRQLAMVGASLRGVADVPAIIEEIHRTAGFPFPAKES